MQFESQYVNMYLKKEVLELMRYGITKGIWTEVMARYSSGFFKNVPGELISFSMNLFRQCVKYEEHPQPSLSAHSLSPPEPIHLCNSYLIINWSVSFYLIITFKQGIEEVRLMGQDQANVSNNLDDALGDLKICQTLYFCREGLQKRVSLFFLPFCQFSFSI